MAEIDEGIEGEVEEQEISFVSLVHEREELRNLEKTLAAGALSVNEAVFERIISIVDKYQEQPQLLDPHLEPLVTPLMAAVRSHINAPSANNIQTVSTIFRVLYVLTKVRGYKLVIRFFPHTVPDLEPALAFLEQQSPTDFSTWETRYILFLWLSIVVLVPFDLTVIDSSISSSNTVAAGDERTLIARMIRLCKQYLSDAARTREAAAELAARLLTRPDMKPSHMVDFLEWAISVLSSSSENSFLKTGVYGALASFFKYGQRRDLLDKAGMILPYCQHVEGSPLQRKLIVKLAQRIGLTFLKPRVAPWRYRRGHRSLAVSGNVDIAKATTALEESQELEENIAVPEGLEDIVENLLTGLRDSDTIVRWSAAKGIGRVTMRLPHALGGDILSSVLELFSESESDSGWHGGCLALAELGRRGLLTPSDGSLGRAVAMVTRAAFYDVIRGAHSVGAHVRDAACYVCWALGRSYAPEILAAVPDWSAALSAMVVAAVFDREVNCRRAAAAAFQENVGRQGNVPHGIEIVTTADYYAVGNRANAYLNLSFKIAQSAPPYRRALIDHVANEKVRHWDPAIRSLAAAALGRLVAVDTNYIVDRILPQLLTWTADPALFPRHGSLLAVAEVVLALHPLGVSLPRQLHYAVVDTVPNLDRLRLYRGKGGEMVRAAACRLIECISRSKLSLDVDRPQDYTPPGADQSASRPPIGRAKPLKVLLREALEESLRLPSDDIQRAAVAAFREFGYEYWRAISREGRGKLTEGMVKTLLSEANPAIRRGYTLALGALPASFFVATDSEPESAAAQATSVLVAVVTALAQAAHIEPNTEQRDAETRRNAVRALQEVCEKVGANALQTVSMEGKPLWRAVLDILEEALADYCIDNRGDVGSWVREAAVQAAESIVRVLCASKTASPLNGEVCCRIVCKLLQQTVEKIDRVRQIAGSALYRLLVTDAPVLTAFTSNVPHLARLQHALTHSASGGTAPVNWIATNDVFARIVPLLDLPEYRPSLLTGLVVSVGGLTKSLVDDSSSALVGYLHSLEHQTRTTDLVSIGDNLLRILRTAKNDDRIVLPMFRGCSLLFQQRCFAALQPPTFSFSADLMQLACDEIHNTKDILKLLAAVPLFAKTVALFHPPVRVSAVKQLLGLMGHRFPKVRRHAAEELQGVLVNLGAELIADESDRAKAIGLLASTRWDNGTATDLREPRFALYTLFGLPTPVLKKVGTDNSAPPS